MVIVLVKLTLLTCGVLPWAKHLLNSLQAVWDSPKQVAFVCNLCYYDWLSLLTLIPQDIIKLPSICEHFNKQKLLRQSAKDF